MGRVLPKERAIDGDEMDWINVRVRRVYVGHGGVRRVGKRIKRRMNKRFRRRGKRIQDYE